MSIPLRWAVLCAAAAVVVAGCRGDDPVKPKGPPASTGALDADELASATLPPETTGPDGTPAAPTGDGTLDPRYATPERALQTILDSVAGGDKEAFVKAHRANAASAKYLAAIFDLAAAEWRLKTAIEAEYGEDGWTVFQDLHGSNSLTTVRFLNSYKVVTATFNESGDRAQVTLDDGQTIPMVRADGRWMLALPEYTQAPEASFDTPMRILSALKQIFDRVAAEVGKPDQTPETLHRLYEQQLHTPRDL